MRISTAVNHLSRFEGRVRAAYEMARLSSWSQAMLLDYLDDALFSTPEWGRVPGWVQAKVQTISSERSKMLYYDVRHPDQGNEPSNCLVWRLRDNQNPTELVANLDGLPDEIWGKGRIEGTYVWLLTGTPWRPWSKVS